MATAAARQIIIPYTPRSAFMPFHGRAQRWSIGVAHRRAGKTVARINDLIRDAVRCKRPEPRFGYVAPLYSQAKDVAWNYLRQFTAPILGTLHHESELRADLPNGARIRLYGADNYERMRGVYFDGVVLDEYGDMDPRAWSEVIRPALADRQGWADFIGTPKGLNHFYKLWLQAKQDPAWFTSMLRASETGLIPQAELDDARKTMSEDQYAQEFECDFQAGVIGAYYARLLMDARKQGRIGRVSADPMLQVHAIFDIGGAGATADAMAIWIVQWVGLEIRVLDYIEGQGQVLAYYVNELRKRDLQSAKCWLPHDGVNANNITGKRYEDHLREAGFDVEVVPNQGRGAAKLRIEATRRILPMCWFNEATTEAGRAALGYYHEKKDPMRDIGLGPEHDWCLAAGTQVLTPGGWREVQDIRVHDEVLTPGGRRRILRSGIVRRTSEWTIVRGIRCTPEHRFFTSMGLVEAGKLSPQAQLWTHDSLGLRILASLSAECRLGFKAAIILATQEDNHGALAGQHSFTAWCMRLCMAQYRAGMKSIMSMMTRSTITLRILPLCPVLSIAEGTNQSPDTSAFAVCAEENLAAAKSSDRGAARLASEQITPGSSENAEPAYNLTVDVDECYFVRGGDGRSYLVSNSSHAADAFGLMACVYRAPTEHIERDFSQPYNPFEWNPV